MSEEKNEQLTIIATLLQDFNLWEDVLNITLGYCGCGKKVSWLEYIGNEKFGVKWDCECLQYKIDTLKEWGFTAEQIAEKLFAEKL